MNDEHALERWRREVRRTIAHADEDLLEEVAQHASQAWLSARAEGLSGEAADRRVRRDLEQWRRTAVPRRRPGGLLAGWLADARYAGRSLRVNPLFTIVAILLTTLAVAATVTAFAMVYGILWRPLPYPQSDRLAALWQVRRGEQGQIAYPDYADLAQLEVFDGAAAIMGGHGNLQIGERIERVNTIGIEAPGYGLLGATARLGRLLNAADADQPVVMISHRLWRTHLHSDADIVGRTIWLSGRTHTVVGVLADGFDFELPITSTLRLERHDIWRVLDRHSPFITRRDASTYEALVRLAPRTTFEQAQATLDAMAQRLAQAHPSTNAERTFRVVSLKAQIVERVERPLLLACGAALSALAIALANLTTLTLVRLSDRRTELAIRDALGAGALRLRRQLLTEHLSMAAAGTGAGYLLAMRIVQALMGSEAAGLPRTDAVRFDAPVLAVAASCGLLVTLVLTLLPFRAGSVSLRVGVRGATRSGRRTRQILVVAELALALALSAGGALLYLSVIRLFATHPGFSRSSVAAVRVAAYEKRYPRLEHVEAFFGTVLERVRALPGTGSVAGGSSLPLSGQTTGTSLVVEGRLIAPGSRQLAGWQFVTPGYFDALGIAIMRGRDFRAADRTNDGHVTILNASLARALFGNEDPVGKRVTTDDGAPTDDWHVIVGVVGDVRHHSLDQEPAPRMYDLLGEHWGRTMYIVVRSRVPHAVPSIAEVRRTIVDLDREAPVFEAATLSSLVERSAAPYRLAASLAGVLALGAVLLALIGVYAVTAAAVSERSREIGIRAALGAAPRHLLQLVLSEGAIMAASGAALGLVGSFAATKLLQSQLFGVSAADVMLIVPAISVAAVVISIGATVPAARRAANADPLVAIQTE